LGTCKTRLAKTIGDAAALQVYTYLLNHTKEVISQIEADKAVYYSVKIRHNDSWEANIFKKYQQFGSDLGERMQLAFSNGFNNGYSKIIIVGSDLYHLKPQHIQEAFKALDNNDVVIGPAQDGGYYLLGLKTMHAPLFKDKQWGTNTVFKSTIEDLKNKTVAYLETLNDIDVYEDLEHITPLQNIIKKHDRKN